jgi:Trk-type K+ transport system membrane component
MAFLTNLVAPQEEKEEDSKEYLQRVRGTSCYPAIRSVIETSFFVLLVILALAAISFVFLGHTTGAAGFVKLAYIAVWILSLTLIIAFRQASHLLIDIADTLLDANRKKIWHSPPPRPTTVTPPAGQEARQT